MTLLVVGGATETAAVEGISAAGADPTRRIHTPAADLEVVVDGSPGPDHRLPLSPTGCPTPAVLTRAIRELVGFDVTAVGAGLSTAVGVPAVSLGSQAGGDIREETPVENAEDLFEAGVEFGRNVDPSGRLFVGETIPGGTTTALGVLRALGERATVSSSLPENPLERKRAVVAAGLRASGLSPGDAAGDPMAAVAQMGDPVLAAVAGIVVGATETETPVTLAGGTQLAAAAALARHAGVEADLRLATTAFVAEDESAGIESLAAALSLDLRVTDPGFDGATHPAMAAYVAGEAKEGVGLGGALARWADSEATEEQLHDQVEAVYDRLTGGDR